MPVRGVDDEHEPFEFQGIPVLRKQAWPPNSAHSVTPTYGIALAQRLWVRVANPPVLKDSVTLKWWHGTIHPNSRAWFLQAHSTHSMPRLDQRSSPTYSAMLRWRPGMDRTCGYPIRKHSVDI